MHSSETVVAARIPPNNLQFGTLNMQPREDQHEEKAYLQNIHAFSAPVHAFTLNFNLFPIPRKLNFHLKHRPSLTGSLGHLKSGHFSFGSHEKSAEGVHKAPVATAVAKQLLKTS